VSCLYLVDEGGEILGVTKDNPCGSSDLLKKQDGVGEAVVGGHCSSHRGLLGDLQPGGPVFFREKGSEDGPHIPCHHGTIGMV
jgi:hypothetical protein